MSPETWVSVFIVAIVFLGIWIFQGHQEDQEKRAQSKREREQGRSDNEHD